MKNSLKKLGYGVVVHYNEYSGNFEVFNVKDHALGVEITEKTKISVNKKAKKAVDEYIEVYMKG